MMRYVVDASVVLKWFLPEPDSDQASKLISARFQLFAPDLLLLETSSALLRCTRTQEYEGSDIARALELLREVFTFVSTTPFLNDALALALTHGGKINDNIYVAYAHSIGLPLLSADGLQQKVAATTGVPVHSLSSV